MPSNNRGKHLTLNERRIIEAGINNGSKKTAIAETLGKDPSTIGKEIKLHRKVTFKCRMPMECSNYRKCKYNRECFAECIDYVPFRCDRRDRSPGACNGCSNYAGCRFTKYRYDAIDADFSYRTDLKESREGFNLTTSEAKEISELITPLLKQGQSPYVIKTNHPELNICEKTMYNYLEAGVFNELDGASNMDLRRQLGRKISKKKRNMYKKRKDGQYLEGRKYSDYKEYLSANPYANTTQMDTVYNDVTNGPFMQTFELLKPQLLLAFLHNEKTSEEMKNGIDKLEEILGPHLFEKHVEILLTDRGSEFILAEQAEMRPDGTRRTRLYYCDPMCSGQKGSLENKHSMLRDICPSGTDLRALGLVSQEALNLTLSHINSTPLESLDGKTPLEACKFFYPELFEKLKESGIVEIPKDKVTLKPYLLKQFL